MKKGKLLMLLGLVSLILVLAAMPLMAACTKEAPAPAPAPAPIKVTMKFPDMGAAGSSRTVAFEWWGNELAKRTNGQVTVEYYWGSSLLKPYEQMEAVQTGAVGVSSYYAAYHPDMAPLPGMALSPFVNSDSHATAIYSGNEWFTTNKHLQDEFKKNNVHYLYPSVFSGQFVFSTVPLTKIEDFQGLRVRSFGPFLALFEALGSALVDVSVAEVYDSLERGAVDASTFPPDFAKGFHLYEICDYVNLTDFGKNVGSPVVINLDLWNKLPDDIKKVFNDLNEEMLPKTVEIFVPRDEEDMKFLKEQGMTFTEFSADDIAKLRETTKTEVWGKYTKSVEEKFGIPAGEAFQNYLDISKKYKAKYG